MLCLPITTPQCVLLFFIFSFYAEKGHGDNTNPCHTCLYTPVGTRWVIQLISHQLLNFPRIFPGTQSRLCWHRNLGQLVFFFFCCFFTLPWLAAGHASHICDDGLSLLVLPSWHPCEPTIQKMAWDERWWKTVSGHSHDWHSEIF